MIDTNLQEALVNDNGTILIIDDQKSNVTILANILSQYGFNVGVAYNGFDALLALENSQPDVILLDIMMPEMDGFELCKRVKANDKTKDIPIIFLTARVDKSDVIKGFEVGGADYLSKPFNAGELFVRINMQLELSRSKKQILAQNIILSAQNEKLEQNSKELANLNANKDKYFSILSHDLRGPFQALLGITETALTHGDSFSYAEFKEMFGMIRETSLNLYSLLENLLTWSRIQMQREVFILQHIEAQNVLNKVADNFQQNLIEKNITFRKLIPDDFTVFADTNAFRRILHNIISNAIKFTPKDGTIEVGSYLAEDGASVVYVKDDGVGMSKETVARLFKIETVFSTRGTSEEEGSGLGLILCHELVSANKGKIWVESELGKGSTVFFSFPENKQFND